MGFPPTPARCPIHWATEPDYSQLLELVREVCLCIKNENWVQGVVEAEAAHPHTHALWLWIILSLPDEPIFSAIYHDSLSKEKVKVEMFKHPRYY